MGATLAAHGTAAQSTMTTRTKLWLGFGTLTALLVLSSVAILVRVRSIEGQLEEMTNARNLIAETNQLEINVLGHSFAVGTYLQIGELKARQNAEREAVEVERHLRNYERLASTDRQREMATRFEPLWQELKKLGQTLLNVENRQAKQGDLTRFFNLSTGLEKLLDDEMQVEAVETYNARRDSALHDARAIVGLALILLIVGAVIAVVTSGAVGRGVVRGERVIAEQGERLRATLSSIGDAVITTDTAGRITKLNPAAESMTGWTRDKATGQPLDAVFRVVNEETRKEGENPAARTLREGVIVGPMNDTVLIAKDGTERPIDDSAAPIRSKGGEIVGCVLVFRDVTEKRRAEEALRESEERFRMLANTAPVLIWQSDEHNRGEFMNAEYVHFLGRPMDELLGGGWTESLHPEDAAAYYDGFVAAAGRRERFDADFRFRRADGEYRWMRTVAVPRFEGGVYRGYIGSTYDIHERKRMEEALKEADRRKDEFLAMLAHELRNPLAPISNTLQVLQLKGGDSKTLQSAMEMMNRQVSQIVRLIDDLLDMSRISRGKIELKKERIELASVVHHAVEAVRPLCGGMDHELTVTIPPQPIFLNGDATRLAQVVGNLLNNACKFTPRDGRIWLTVEREGPRAIIRVRDTGIGIAAEQLSGIFKMFTQIDTSLERTQGGLGIGLTLVKNLVEMHDGTVEASSPGVGRGTEFAVRLPILTEPPVSPPPEPAGVKQAATVKRRILVVDDNRDSADSLAMLLKLTGHEAQIAHDGVEAVEAAAKFQPDVILLDIGLPKLNGYEAARRIREQQGKKGLVMVALTGWGQEEDRRRSEEAGFDAHMVKPVDHDALTKLLAELAPAR
jgi:PAS domain S-box-containing protein